jgi:23S rRNA-/tRNA-specific pseudouridylate synthase
VGDVWVMNKPTGYAVHTGHDKTIPSLVGWCRQHMGVSKEWAPVHRLDRPTSGIVLCAESSKSRARLSEMFADGAVHKEYRTLTYGNAPPEGTIDRALNDRRRGRIVEATTHFSRLRAYRLLTYLAVFPETGRKHQIRRHLRGVGLPIIGDQRYGPKPPPRVPGFPGRLWLHAFELRLPDGQTFTAPLPSELAEQIALLDQIEGVSGDEDHTNEA